MPSETTTENQRPRAEKAKTPQAFSNFLNDLEVKFAAGSIDIDTLSKKRYVINKIRNSSNPGETLDVVFAEGKLNESEYTSLRAGLEFSPGPTNEAGETRVEKREVTPQKDAVLKHRAMNGARKAFLAARGTEREEDLKQQYLAARKNWIDAEDKLMGVETEATQTEASEIAETVEAAPAVEMVPAETGPEALPPPQELISLNPPPYSGKLQAGSKVKLGVREYTLTGYSPDRKSVV